MGGIAFLVDIRVLALVGTALLLLLALAAWGLTLGNLRLPPAEILEVLRGAGAQDATFIILNLRLPRVLAAVLVGALMAMSGAIFQGLVRNPLVSPDIIGINAGAAFAAVFWIITSRSLELLPGVAFTGALLAAAGVYILSWRGRMATARLVLVGIGINALLTAGTTFLLKRAEIHHASRAVLWITGSVYGSDWGDVRVLAAALMVLAPLGTGLIWSLRVLQFGDLTAQSLGMPLERTRLTLILVGCALSAFAVSVAGPIGFVALMAPHAARMLAGPMSGGVFLFTGVLGALVVLGADLVGQHALPASLPAGVVTAALGAPYFLFLLYRTNMRM